MVSLAVTCPVLEDSPSVVVSQRHLEVGSSMTQTCKEGYHIITGDMIRVCQMSGQWSGSPTVCEGEPELRLSENQTRFQL